MFVKFKYHLIALILMPIVLFGGFWLMLSGVWAEESAVEPSVNESLIAELNKQIDAEREKIDALADKIEEHNATIKKFRSESANLKNQLSILDNQTAKTNLDISAKEKEIELTGLEIQRVELEIKDSELLVEDNKDRLSAFIRLLDNYDERDYLSVLLSNESFSEFFDQIKRIESIEEDLQKTLNRFQEVIEKLNSQKAELDEKRTKLSELLNKLESQKIYLGEQVNNKNYLINQTKSSERKFQILIDDLKAEQTAANNAIAGMERKIRAELEKRGEGEKFNNFGDAVLSWPTASRRITSYFHDPDYPYRNLFEHSGLDIGVPSGTAVMSAEAGYVAKVAIGTKWYGNYIMIIHNNNLATLYAHLSSVNVEADQYVAKGQSIGASGNTGFSSGPHLHFEVRANGIPVNPSSYLP